MDGAMGESAGLSSERKEGDPSLFPLVPMVQMYDPAFDPREKFLSDSTIWRMRSVPSCIEPTIFVKSSRDLLTTNP